MLSTHPFLPPTLDELLILIQIQLTYPHIYNLECYKYFGEGN